MRVQIDCYPCILGQLTSLAKKVTGDDDERRQIVKGLLQQVTDADEETTPPELAAGFHRAIREMTGIADGFRAVKDASTRLALELLPELQQLVAQSTDPFETAVRLAIGGNVIDYGVNPHFELSKAEQAIREVLELPFDRESAAELKRQMDRADSILYMLDNCGEAVVDRLLIERYRDKITLGMRGEPILNDVTEREAVLSGLGDLPRCDTGDMAPGVSMRYSSPQFLQTLRNADLVISKGQGNFESLESYDRPIFFLLKIKCSVVARRVDKPLGSLLIKGMNLHA